MCSEEAYWDMFGTYRTLASFCAFDYEGHKIEKQPGGKS